MALQQQLQEYLAHHPKARPYTIAQDLNVSEMAILEVSTDKTITYLGDQYQALLTQLAPLGKVMSLTRNEHAVSETRGPYDNVSFMEKAPMGIAHNPIIDLRYFTHLWAHVYAVSWMTSKRQLHSFQIFDRYGRAVHKIYTTPASNVEAYHTLVQQLAIPEGRQGILEPIPADTVESQPPLSAVDLATFQGKWLAMQDTHDFFGLLKEYGLQQDRQRAFASAPEGHAYPVDKTSIVPLLEYVAAQEIPIMIFLGNRSCLQIFSGPIKRLVPMEAWYNILDRDFNLHLQLNSIAHAWVVKKCTSDGIVTSLELFDHQGQHILYCFGQRKPGIPELKSWRTAIEQLAPLPSDSLNR